MSEIYSPEEDSYLLSEVLKKELPKLLKENPNITFLEIGCGSGIQLQTALNVGVKKENIFAVDINPEAVKYCKKLGFNCIISNLFENVKDKYNIIIFNPPYLPEDKHESRDSKLATTGGKKGGEIINKFLNSVKKYLNIQGKVFLLTSSLTKKINFKEFQLKILATKKIFFEELYVFELKWYQQNPRENY